METDCRIYRVDMLIWAACIAAFALLEALIADPNSMMEADLYRMLFGLLDGATTGKGVLDPVQYGAAFSFGYLKFIYCFAGDAIHHPDQLMAFMNHIGYWSALGCMCSLWLALALAYGSSIGTATALIFCFSPLFITLGASGHPILPAYMFLMAGASLIFLRSEGVRKTLLNATGIAAIALGMTLRADIVLALPWIALTHPGAASARDFIKLTLRRALLLLSAFIAFLLIRHFVLAGMAVEAHPQTLHGFIGEFFNLHNMIGGGMSALLGAGLATTLAFPVIFALLLRFGKQPLPRYFPLAGPLAVMLVALVFWLPVGVNSRHFITFLLGTGLFIMLVAASFLHWNRTRLLALAVALVVATQVLGEMLRPVFLRSYAPSYTAIPDMRRTFTMAPLGFTWEHIKALQLRHRVYEEWTHNLGMLCDEKIVVMMDYDDAEQGMASLYGNGQVASASLIALDGFKRVVSIIKGRQVFVFIVKAEVWPADPLAQVLGQPELDRYKIFIDPYSASVYDHAPLPAERAARTGCIR